MQGREKQNWAEQAVAQVGVSTKDDAPGDQSAAALASSSLLQMQFGPAAIETPEQARAAAADGVAGARGSLPFADRIQQSFGAEHDVSGIRAQVGGPAADACEQIGAAAYATGDAVAFKSSPDLHTAAHEAAHVVQQQQGVQLYGGVGVAGDAFEQQADRVADRVVAGESATDLLGKSSAGPAPTGAAVQRKEEAKPAPAGTSAAPVAEAQPAGDGADAAAKKPKPNTTKITFTADYTEVPGKGKERVSKRDSNDALWFDPLAVHSNTPHVARSMASVGVVAGTGQQTIDSFDAPITEGENAVGMGSVSPNLRFAKEVNKSFDVQVDGLKGSAAKTATKVARKYLESEMKHFGDVDEMQTSAAAHLAEKGFEGATVTVSVRANKTTEVGMDTFYYRARNNPQIMMEVLAIPEGEKTTGWSSTKSESHGEERASERHGEKKVDTDSERHGESSRETVDVEYDKLVVDTLNRYVHRVDTARKELISKLSDVVIKDETYHKGGKSETKRVTKSTDDLTKTVKKYEEKGKKDKKNWAAKLKGPLSIVKDVIKIPYIDKIPYLRKVQGWQLDLLDAGLDAFATEGKVDYTDSKETTKEKDKHSGTDTTNTKDSVDVKSHSKEDRKRELEELMTSKSESSYNEFKRRVETTTESYSKVTEASSEGGSDRVKTSTSGGGSDSVKTDDQTSKSVTVSGTTTWKFTKPAIKATVVAGDGDVAGVPFTAAKEKPAG